MSEFEAAFRNRMLGGGRPFSPDRRTTTPSPMQSSTWVKKGFGVFPNHARMHAITRRALAARAAPTQPAMLPSASPAQPPAEASIFLLFLFGPAAVSLRSQVQGVAPYVDRDTGASVHWLMYGCPRRSRDAFRSFLAKHNVTKEQLDSEWNTLLDDRADEVDVAADGEARTVQQLQLPAARLPLLIVYAASLGDAPLVIKLPPRAAHDSTVAADTIRVLREELSPNAIERACAATAAQPSIDPERALVDYISRVQTALDKVDADANPSAAECDGWALRAIGLLASGLSVTKVAKLVRKSRKTLYTNKHTRATALASQKIASMGKRNLRRGEMNDGVADTIGVTDAEADTDADPLPDAESE